ncbi:M23 family metallopeptidase [Bacillus sp. 2205SS5-2]|uniref:M23 family metallopeptidase n=1 Tax=Bacillus sp. 2205SS5-2 TaxID=3109031 RepID=UPI00300773C8
MSNRADEIRKQLARKIKSKSGNSSQYDELMPTDEERYGGERFSSYVSEPPMSTHPLFNKETFLLKLLLSAVMVLSVGILYKNSSPALEEARSYVQSTMGNEFQFAAVSAWYEEQFGKPLSFIPKQDASNSPLPVTTPDYAVPASGKIIEDFDHNGKGVMVETGMNEKVKALKGGFVLFAGKNEEFGNMVILQHSDKSESWYGNLENIEVDQYSYVEIGSPVGQVKNNEDSGEFYFAIKQENDFIDPIQVMTFE